MFTSSRDKRLTITLWEEKAKQFQDLYKGILVFVVISGLLAKSFAVLASNKFPFWCRYIEFQRVLQILVLPTHDKSRGGF